MIKDTKPTRWQWSVIRAISFIWLPLAVWVTFKAAHKKHKEGQSVQATGAHHCPRTPSHTLTTAAQSWP